ncbi:hypothetical protein EGW08_015828 [Elysia chlorotica]|uniref:Carboxylesterase type B domain-containing protein n=1 Tax=Elysia chlorotica TaxID=188477 RepID=A0A433T4E0_ELYCH|nr:hypothetical protein EGW08_015828 [Elysia chlorotica]
MPSPNYKPLREENVVPFDHLLDNTDPTTITNANITNHSSNTHRQGEGEDFEASSTETRISPSDDSVNGDKTLDECRVSSPSASESQKPYAHRNRPRECTAKYTALRPTSVRQLGPNLDLDPEAPTYPSAHPPYSDTSEPEDLEFYDSTVALTTTKARTGRMSRFHIALCGLLVAACAVLGLGLLYVFVILPANKGVVLTPGGKGVPSADTIRLKHLGDNVAVTSCGLVRGTFEDGAHVFRGIPYAVPPLDSLRWQPPVPRSYESGTCWHDVLNTTSFSSVCAQPVLPRSSGDVKTTQNSDLDTTRDKNLQITGSEDCLYLNVWTPSLNPPDPLPVLVWIHSGDFVYGSGHASGMTPTAELAAMTNAVYVSFNYRLGVLGFLALDALRERHDSALGATGNYGVMDQQLALQWVKDNARYFGGDHNKVTVFGHGSGATSIQALLLSSASSGLFHSAWMSSPVALLNKTLDEACRDNEPMMAMTGCSDAHCLRKLDTPTLVSHSPWSLEPRWTLDRLLDPPNHRQLGNSLAIFDGHVVHWDSMKHGPMGPTVPVVLGATYSDLPGLLTNLRVSNLTWDRLDSVLVHYLTPLGTEAQVQIKSRYSQMSRAGYFVLSSPMPKNAEFFPLPSRQFARFVRDIQTVCPSKILADKLNGLLATSAQVYLYISEAFPSHELKLENSDKSSPDLRMSADELFIGWDMVAFFGSFREFRGFSEQQADISFQNIVRQELLSLARGGKPNAARWQTEGINTGLLRSEVTVSPAPEDYFDSCKILHDFDFFRYTWNKNG